MLKHIVVDKRTGAIVTSESAPIVMYRPGEELTIREVPLGPDGEPDTTGLGEGEVVTSEELARILDEEGWAVGAPRKRSSIFARRPRWRNVKRR
ncbi:MAG: hypothetical protein KF773_09455 [Deltaproteobacteria bacterium]|nr:hypothetical protein [Deltaproteobacteria bacterium]MCW5804043.1 hypothetical protein [Deltaproteobacteria bacterium]